VRKLYILILTTVLCISLFVPLLCKADPVWSDNFDDLNYDGWTVTNGTFTAADGTLRPTGGSWDYYIIVHPSTVTTGTWSFDVTGLTEAYGPSYENRVLYMCVTPVPRNGWRAAGLLIGGSGPEIGAWASIDGEHDAVRLGEAWDFPSDASRLAWQHINITRGSDGRLCVYVNGTLVIDAAGWEQNLDLVTTSNYFCFATSQKDFAIDNIVVSDTVDIQPPPPKPAPTPFYLQPMFLGLAGLVVVGAVVLTVLYLRRRK